MQHAWEVAMDFIERIFGVSPDGGDGSLEFFCMLIMAVVTILTAYALYIRWKRQRSGSADPGSATAVRSDGESPGFRLRT
jgi:hypothetical protein